MITPDKRKLYSDSEKKPPFLPVEPENIPCELRLLKRWMLWVLIWANTRWSKVPQQANGRHADSTNPATWDTFAKIDASHAGGKGDGIGFALGDGYAGIDLDDCRDPASGELAPWAQRIIEDCGSYTEVSPSGTGAKIIGRGIWSGSWHKKAAADGGDIEVYDSGRYFTLTGHRLNGHGINDISRFLESLVVEYGDRPKPTGDYPPHSPSLVTAEDDAEVIRLATKARNGAKFVRLWAGDTSEHGDDKSRADLALCGTLAFYCGPDPDRIERLFRLSGLMREKWDSRRGESTYGRATIAKALAGRTEFHFADGTQHEPSGSSEGPPLPGPPQPFGRTAKPPRFPVDVLPAWLGEFVIALSRSTQTPEDAAAMLAIAAIAGGLAGKFRYRIRDQWRKHANLYIVVAMDPGERKSAVFAVVFRPVFDAQKNAKELARPLIAAAIAERGILEARLKQVQTRAAKEKDPNELGMLRREVADLAAEIEAFAVPVDPVYTVDDETPESLARTMILQGGRLLQAAAEGTAFEIAGGRYSERENLDVYLKAHDGDPFSVGRISRERLHHDGPVLTCGLAVQPDVLHGIGASKRMKSRGFLARWLYAVPSPRVGGRQIRPEPADEAVVGRYNARLVAVWAMDTPDAPVEVPFSREADDRLAAFERRIEPRCGPDGDLTGLAAWGTKLAGEVARIAGLIHIAGLADPAHPGAVSADAVDAAVRIADEHLIPHAKIAFGVMNADEHEHVAQRAVSWLERRPELASVTRRDLYQGLKGGQSDLKADDLLPALDLLIEYGYLRPTAAPAGPGRRPEGYVVNPFWPRGGAGETIPHIPREQEPEVRQVDPEHGLGDLGDESAARDGVAPPVKTSGKRIYCNNTSRGEGGAA